jgi:transcriptional regulator with XRE-family HTH domain
MRNEVYRAWGVNIRSLMAMNGLTQSQLAERVGVTPATVCRWVNGDMGPRDDHKVSIAEALNSDVRAVFPLVRGMGR